MIPAEWQVVTNTEQFARIEELGCQRMANYNPLEEMLNTTENSASGCKTGHDDDTDL